MMLFYRGITVTFSDADRVREDILTNGLHVEVESTYKLSMINLRPQLSQLFDNKNLSYEDTRPKEEAFDTFSVVCACGDAFGATYYATSHNMGGENTVPLIIKFKAPIEDIWIDGRDFLYNAVFQQGYTLRQREIALKLYGKALGKYIDKAWSSNEQDYRIAMCDLAINDLNVISQHHKNELVIGGRYNTKFKSAFMVKLPISHERIISVTSPERIDFQVDISREAYRNF